MIDIEYIERNAWGMPGRLGPFKSGPFDGVDLHHVGSLDTGGDPIRDLYHAAEFTNRRWGRVSYNGGIDMDAMSRLLEMQGADHIGAHNDGENSRRYGLVVAGNFEEQDAPDELVEAIAASVLFLYKWRMIARPHIKGHRDSDATACPGIKLYRRLPEVREIIEGDDMARTKPASWAREAVEDLRREGVLANDGDLDSVVTEERFAVFLHRAKQKGYFDTGSGGGGLTVAQVHAIIKGTGLEPGQH